MWALKGILSSDTLIIIVTEKPISSLSGHLGSLHPSMEAEPEKDQRDWQQSDLEAHKHASQPQSDFQVHCKTIAGLEMTIKIDKEAWVMELHNKLGELMQIEPWRLKLFFCGEQQLGDANWTWLENWFTRSQSGAVWLEHPFHGL